jgi:hypothetical protein
MIKIKCYYQTHHLLFYLVDILLCHLVELKKLVSKLKSKNKTIL